MASEVGICNMALSHIGSYRIASLNEPSKESRLCKVFYEPTRDSVLEEHDWGFARKEQTLALLTTTYSGWNYTYIYPSDCIAPRYIYNSITGVTETYWNYETNTYTQTGKIEYEIRTNETNDQRLILTNQENAILIYTALIVYPPLFTKMFIDALSWRLAADLSIPMKADKNMEAKMLNRYFDIIGKARASMSNAENRKINNINTFTGARN